MDVIITAIGEFVWAASCAVVNSCVSSGFSVLAVFVSLLCAILASAFYKYNTSRERMSFDNIPSTSIDQIDNDLEKSDTVPLVTTTTTTTTDSSTSSSTLSVVTDDQTNPSQTIESLTEIEINVNENTSVENGVNQHEISNDILIDTVEGTEEEIQKQQIANIYRLLNDQHLINNWSTTDFLDQLKMYGLHTYDDEEEELESSSP